MERDDEDERPQEAGPEQEGEGFATGYGHEGHTPEDHRKPDYARGIDHERTEAEQEPGRFSEGSEELPDTPDKRVERRFSEGSERSPTSE